MRVPIMAGLVVAIAATLAACGTVAAPMASPPHPHAGGAKPASARPAPPAGSRAEAAALARLMLSRLRLPAGTRRLPPTPVPQSVSKPSLWAGAAATLDVHQLFELARSMDAAAVVLTAHVPAGMSLAVTGETGGPAGVTSQEVGYAARSVPAGVDAAQLVLTVVPTMSGGSFVRADAQVTWIPPRTAAEYIDPARYHVLMIALTTFSPRLHTIHRVVTSQAAITRLAEALNQSQVNPITTEGCPSIFAAYRLAFAVSRQDAPGVVVTASLGPCEGAQVSVGGRKQPSLRDDAAVVAVADRLLGVTPRP
jgi:hypothetical protein